jgi:hypothetical protein
MSDAEKDPLEEFRAAHAKYRACKKDFLDYEEGLRRDNRASYIGPPNDQWKTRDRNRQQASEGLWVSGVAALFSLLTTNYKAQERIVERQLQLADKQLECAKESSAAAAMTARWTIVMAVIAAAALVVGLYFQATARQAQPITPQAIYVQPPTLSTASPAPTPTPADPQSPQPPERDP